MGIASRFAAKAAKEAAAKAAAKAAKLAVKPRLALPAPPKPLALPAPGPGLPRFAAKPRGGQFWADKDIMEGGLNASPEAAARYGAQDLGIRTNLSVRRSPAGTPEQQWLEKALTKYYKNDFGSPDDPLRDLAERGLHYDVEMTPERWQQTVNDYLLEDNLQDVLFPPNRAGGMPGAGSDLRGQTLAAMPWLAKVPATDSLYGISGGGLDLEHFSDEFANALKSPEASGLPMDLAVRPESLGRMTFAQAAERVGRINQFRAKEMERAALGNLDSPAVQTFKEYADDNPMGLRWTELKAPDEGVGFTIEELVDPASGKTYFTATNPATGESFPAGVTREAAVNQARQAFSRDPLEQALKYEGDTMGHCVGGYCPDVMEGRSRIFSLRDAKGEPHVTVETAPVLTGISGDILNQMEPGIWDKIVSEGGHYDTFDWLKNNRPDLLARFDDRPTEEIIQIKGKQNRAPKDDYLPFVQDFVKSGKWSNVGDLGNTGLVRLPDGRYITQQQWQDTLTPELMQSILGTEDLPEIGMIHRRPDMLREDIWEQVAPRFEGYAIGGRVSADRCFSKGKSAVYAVNKARK